MKEVALKLDREDPLSHFREQFHIPQRNEKDSIYLCGNSMGLQPKKVDEYLASEIENWKKNGVEGQVKGERPWLKHHLNGKESLARLVGGKPNEVIAMNSLTTNLHQAMGTFYRPVGKRTKVIIERGAFPSDYYSIYSQIASKDQDPKKHLIELAPSDGSDYLPLEEIINKIRETRNELALVLFPGVQYYTGQSYNMVEITKVAHEVGAFAGFDLAHSIGNLPMNLHDDNVDFAVWCGYKYLNSGPGAIGGLFIHENHTHDMSLSRWSSWWGHSSKAIYKTDYDINPIASVDGWQLSISSILANAVQLSSLAIFDEANIHRLRKKSIKLTSFLEELLLNTPMIRKHTDIITPANTEERGCQLSIRLKSCRKEVFDRLTEAGVIASWKEPDMIRLTPTPLYNSFTDVYEFVQLFDNALAKG